MWATFVDVCAGLFLLSVLAVFTLCACAMAASRSDTSRRQRPSDRIDHEAERIRHENAITRGAIHHPLEGHPIEYATIDELMPSIVEVEG